MIRTQPEGGESALKRALSLRDLVLFNIVAVLGLRWLSTSARFGPGALLLWLLAALFFFVPQGLAVIDLSSRFPEEGGIYAWTKHSFGEGHGFLCGWCYWINNVLYYPNLLISTAVIATFAIGKGESGLAENWSYVLICSLVALWLAAGLNIVGVGTGKWLQNVGGIGTYVPGIILIGLGAYAWMTQPSATLFSGGSLLPNWSDFSSLNLLASIAFAFAGLELSSSMGGEIVNPARNLPRSIFIAAPLIALAYILGTGAVLWLVPHGKVNLVSGFLQAISSGSGLMGPWLFWLVPLAAVCYSLGNLGGAGAWLSGPARVAFVIGLDRYFPPSFGKVHRRWGTPYVAILVQAGLATIFLFLSVLGKGTTVERAYLILLDTQVLIYFVPYIYLFLVYMVQRRRRLPGGEEAGGRSPGAVTTLVGMSGLLVTLFAMIVALVPPPGTSVAWVFELKVAGGATAFILLGEFFYWRARLSS